MIAEEEGVEEAEEEEEADGVGDDGEGMTRYFTLLSEAEAAAAWS